MADEEGCREDVLCRKAGVKRAGSILPNGALERRDIRQERLTVRLL
jgi:hypothetical protein